MRKARWMSSTNQKSHLDISQPMGKGKLDVFHQSETRSEYFSVNQKLNNYFYTNEESKLDVFHQSDTRSRYFSTNGDRQAGYLSINQLDAIEIFLPQLSHFSLIKTWLNIR